MLEDSKPTAQQQRIKVFACPAGDRLNKHNEQGSLGFITFQLIDALIKTGKVCFTAVNFKSYGVDNGLFLRVFDVFKGFDAPGIKSFIFYLTTFFSFRDSEDFKTAQIAHHFLPFGYSLGFNLFFIFRKQNKRYVIGPILGRHLDLVELSDDPDYFDRGRRPGKLDRLKYFLQQLLFPIIRLVFYLPHRITLKRADCVIFADQYAYSPYKGLLEPQKVKIIPTGVDLHKFDKKSLSHEGDYFEILFVGRLGKRKGAHMAIQAFSELIERVKQGVRFRIVGDGAMLEELKKQVVQLGVQHHVKFEGRVPNFKLAEFYSKAQILWLPALSDTWMTTMEALSCGLPVITTNIGAHSEHVIDGVNGYLVEPFSTQKMVQKTLELIDDPGLLKRLGDNAYKLARDKYDLNKIAKQYLDVYQNLTRSL